MKHGRVFEPVSGQVFGPITGFVREKSVVDRPDSGVWSWSTTQCLLQCLKSPVITWSSSGRDNFS